MKSDIVYGLVSATWPAMIVDEAGAVHNVNPAAVRAFGPSMADGTGTLPALWLPDNQETAAELLARCASQAAVNVPLKLLGKNKANLPYQASICAIQDDGKKYFLIQLFPEASAAATAAEGKGSTVEAGLAHKQKLDCALQLARTVSLDFNNALTSILGHVSFLLSKAEAGHPWRHALMEVEKS